MYPFSQIWWGAGFPSISFTKLIWFWENLVGTLKFWNLCCKYRICFYLVIYQLLWTPLIWLAYFLYMFFLMNIVFFMCNRLFRWNWTLLFLLPSEYDLHTTKRNPGIFFIWNVSFMIMHMYKWKWLLKAASRQFFMLCISAMFPFFS